MFNFFKKTKVVEIVEVVEIEEVDISVDDIIESHTTSVSSCPQESEDNYIEKIAANNRAIKFLGDEIYLSSFENESVLFRHKKEILEEENKNLKIRKKQDEFEKIYPKIDLSFLSMKQENKDEKSRITRFVSSSKEIVRLPVVPRFSIHQLEKNNISNKFYFRDCIITVRSLINSSDHCAISQVSLNINNNFIFKNIVKVFVSGKIEKGMNPPYRDESEWRVYMRSIKGCGSWYDTDIQFAHKFIGLMPTKTKEKIKEVEKDFSKIYLIKECESWTSTVVTRDPIIVGMVGEQAYLIDHFDCTDMEKYVKDQFTE